MSESRVGSEHESGGEPRLGLKRRDCGPEGGFPVTLLNALATCRGPAAEGIGSAVETSVSVERLSGLSGFYHRNHSMACYDSADVD